MAGVPNDGDSSQMEDDTFKMSWNLQQDDLAKAISAEGIDSNIDQLASIDSLDLVNNPSLWMSLENSLSGSQELKNLDPVSLSSTLEELVKTATSDIPEPVTNPPVAVVPMTQPAAGESPSSIPAVKKPTVVTLPLPNQPAQTPPQTSGVTKVILTPSSLAVASSKGKQIFITVQSGAKGTAKAPTAFKIPNNAKMITWQQAQQLGIKLPNLPLAGKGATLLPKSGNLTVVSSASPAVQPANLRPPSSLPQKIVLRPSSPAARGQIIKLSAAQAIAAGLVTKTSTSSTSSQLNLTGNKFIRVVTSAGTPVSGSTSQIQFLSTATATSGKQQSSVTKSSPTVVNVVKTIPTVRESGSVSLLAANHKAAVSAASTTASSVNLSDGSFTVPPPPKKLALEKKEKREDKSATVGTETAAAQNAVISFLEANGLKPRRPCNCTKSHCLKMYCECFANGEFCNGCNCTCCSNNLQHETERSQAVKACLDRNPLAFKPKIGVGWGTESVRHSKGCHCKRSGCLKNYCECYEAKLTCSAMCRCVGCSNVGRGTNRLRIIDRKRSRHPSDPSPQEGNQSLGILSTRPLLNLMTEDVVEATCQCLLAQAEEAKRIGKDTVQMEGLVLEEFGKCLFQIIEASAKSKGTPAL